MNLVYKGILLVWGAGVCITAGISGVLGSLAGAVILAEAIRRYSMHQPLQRAQAAHRQELQMLLDTALQIRTRGAMAKEDYDNFRKALPAQISPEQKARLDALRTAVYAKDANPAVAEYIEKRYESLVQSGEVERLAEQYGLTASILAYSTFFMPYAPLLFVALQKADPIFKK
jgi:hypothetical protein